MRKHKIVIAILIVLSCIYLVQVLALPPQTASLEKYHLTAASARLISLTFMLPLMAVWAVALMGYMRIRDYADSIRKTKDGAALDKLSQGLLALALWMPTNTVVQGTLNRLRFSHPTMTEEVIITNNYLNIILLIIVGYLIWQGSRKLLAAIKVSPKTINRNFLYVGTAAVGAVLSFLVLMNPAKTIPPDSGGPAAYYLPTWLLITTVLIPYIAIWYLGMEAVQNIHVYRYRVKGIIYKSALGYIASGVGVSAISVLTVRSLAAQTAWFSTLTLKLILIIVYGLVIMIGIGYLLVWIGAKKLQLIEDV
jgi:hypothetical protein